MVEDNWNPRQCLVELCQYHIVFRDADFPLFSVFPLFLARSVLRRSVSRFPFFLLIFFLSVYLYVNTLYFLLFYLFFLNFLSLFVFIFCKTPRTVIFAKVQWHPCVFDHRSSESSNEHWMRKVRVGSRPSHTGDFKPGSILATMLDALLDRISAKNRWSDISTLWLGEGQFDLEVVCLFVGWLLNAPATG